MRYLNPKADLTFKRVFGEHKDITISFLNAMLPFEEGKEIATIEYLNPEQVPDNPGKKDSIVDVRCTDQTGRQFIVEMQVHWTPAFKQRVLFNASKAYVRQMPSGTRWEMLQPVYVLSLVDAIFEPDLPEFFHPYHIVHELHSDRVIDGLHLYFVELPKFTPQTHTERRITALWLRFLTEINEQTRIAPAELMDDAQVRKAVELVETSAYTDAQMLAYDEFWNAVSTENSWMYQLDLAQEKVRQAEEKVQKAEEKVQEAEEKAQEQVRQAKIEARMEAEHAVKVDTARKLKALGMVAEAIAQVTGLTIEEVAAL